MSIEHGGSLEDGAIDEIMTEGAHEVIIEQSLED
jgi:hypothetical protein